MFTRLLHGMIGAMVGALFVVVISHTMYGGHYSLEQMGSAALALGFLGVLFGHPVLSTFKNLARLRL